MPKQDHIPVPRYRSFAGPAVFTQGFRPFFLLSGVWAALTLAFSFEMIQGRLVLPTAFDAISWHYHEMLFGYVAATIAGFMLTAIPNWTGNLPLQGLPLILLAVLWLAGRAAVATSGVIGVWPAALIDLAFLAALGAVALREIVAGRNWRNLVMVGALALFLVCNGLLHVEVMGLVDTGGAAQRLSVAVVVMLICLVGGRVIPSFTRNWLVKRNAERLPQSFGKIDRVALAATVIAFVAWVFTPGDLPTAVLIGIAALLNFCRLARWRGAATYREPLLVILHIGYLWIPAGLALLALSWWTPAVSETAAVHALTVGGIGTMTLAVMSRAILGHTGRALHAGFGLTLAFTLVTLAAVLRVTTALAGQYDPLLLGGAAVAWIAAFLVFLWVCGPMLINPRPE